MFLITEWRRCHHLGMRDGLGPDPSYWHVLNDTIMGGITVMVVNRLRPWVLMECASEIRFVWDTFQCQQVLYYLIKYHSWRVCLEIHMVKVLSLIDIFWPIIIVMLSISMSGFLNYNKTLYIGLIVMMEIFKLSKRRLHFQPAPGRQRLPLEMSAELSPNRTCCVVVIM